MSRCGCIALSQSIDRKRIYRRVPYVFLLVLDYSALLSTCKQVLVSAAGYISSV